MQALEFTAALREIIKELRVEEIIRTIQNLLNPVPQGQAPPLADSAKDQFSELLMSSRSGFDRLMTLPGTGKILTGLDVKEFFDPSRIRRVIHAVSGAPTIPQVQSITDLHAYLERFKSLHRLYLVCQQLLEVEKVGTIPPNDGILQLELINYADEDGISAKRLGAFVQIVTELHTEVAIVLGVKSDSLTFKYFDSGSDVLVGIQCAKSIAETINTLLLQWWDKLRFWRHDTLDRRMESISKSLDIFDKLQESVSKGSITPEEAGNLKVRIFKQVDDLIGIGATIPLTATASVDQKQLLTEMRNTKLLGRGDAARADNESGGKPDQNKS